MVNSKKRTIIFFVVLGIAVLAALFLNIFIGSTNLSLQEILCGIAGNGNAADIIWKIRIPRALAALLLGGALSLSGYLLQTFFHNPIAGPFVLGISSGAKLTVAIALIVAMNFIRSAGSIFMIASAFVGSLITMAFVLLVSRKMKRMSMLVVCGIMIGYISSAITDFIVTFADDSDIVNLHDWSRGTFSGTGMDDVLIMTSVISICIIGCLFISKPIGAFMIGEDYAKNLGVNINLLKVLMVILSGMLSAVVTAFAGPISFVGIAVPHIMRVIFKTSKPLVMIPACFFGGSVFCMLCDMIARTALSPSELSISTVTAIFGAPVVIIMLLQRKRGEL